MLRILSCLLLLTCLMSQVSAQTVQTGVGRDQKSVQMVRTTVAPVIDGVLDDAVWERGALIDDLHQIIPVEYAVPSERTEIRLLYDDNFLYVGAKLFIDPAQISHNVMRRNGNISQDDFLFVSFDPFNNQRGGFYFGVNANGVRQDGIYRNVSEFFGDWDGIFYVETSIVDDGWIAEYAIPFKSISFDPASDTWGLNFSRKIQSRNEQMTWVSNDRRYDPSSAGKAIGFEGLEQGLGLDVIPSVSLNRAKRYDPAGTENNFEPSLDVFYKVTSALNASVTINTDFSATEVDDRQVNLTRFGLFFPEKREFFLRDSDIFEFGRISQNGQPFFSRKIGLGKSGEAIDLNAGAKVSGRVGDWEIGALSIRQDESPGVAADTLSVVRLKTGVLAESTVGAIFTDGDPTSNLDNSLAGADFLYRNSRIGNGRIFEVAGWYQQTSTEGITDDDTAQGISVFLPSTEGLSGGVSARRYDQNFYPALGFVNRVGVDYFNSELNYTWRPDSDRWQTLYYSLRAERYNDVNGDLQSQSLGVIPLELTSSTGDAVFLRSNFEKEVLTTPFRIYPGVVIPVGSYDFQNHGIEFRSAQYRKVSGRLAYVDGSFYGGDQTKVFGSVTWQPSPRIRTNLGFNITDVKLPQGDFITRLMTAGFDYVFSNSLSLVNLVQYDNVSETAGLNMRLHWIPQEGQEFFFVINHTLEDFDDNSFDSYYTDVTAKFSYTFRY